ncbi:J domain-containing protein [Pseudomonas lactucae]|uniref:J domain-containing protein n=1 Tax=Pseudomonas lactucae TaxID=2813360 RepID=UPI002FCD4771
MSGELMPTKSNTSQLTISAKNKPKLSSAQRKFNSLLKKIDKQRQTLLAWDTAMPRYQQRWHAEFKPLHVQYAERQLSLLNALDHAGDRLKLAKVDRQTLQTVICELATSLMDDTNREQMKALYNKHSGADFDDDERRENLILKEAMEQAYDIKLGDDFDFGSPEELALHLQERLEEQNKTQSGQPERDATAREKKDQEQAHQASQSLRAVYRKLASALHPDRETDEAERQRKTTLMQRANKAYAERNLLELLELQLEAEHLDPVALQTMSDERLKHYNRVLSEQYDGLVVEVSAVAFDFARLFDLDPFTPVTVANSASQVNLALKELEYQLRDLEQVLVEIDSPKGLKRWLKAERAAMEDNLLSAFDEFDFFDEPDFSDDPDFPDDSNPFMR